MGLEAPSGGSTRFLYCTDPAHQRLRSNLARFGTQAFKVVRRSETFSAFALTFAVCCIWVSARLGAAAAAPKAKIRSRFQYETNTTELRLFFLLRHIACCFPRDLGCCLSVNQVPAGCGILGTLPMTGERRLEALIDFLRVRKTPLFEKSTTRVVGSREIHTSEHGTEKWREDHSYCPRRLFFPSSTKLVRRQLAAKSTAGSTLLGTGHTVYKKKKWNESSRSTKTCHESWNAHGTFSHASEQKNIYRTPMSTVLVRTATLRSFSLTFAHNNHPTWRLYVSLLLRL